MTGIIDSLTSSVVALTALAGIVISIVSLVVAIYATRAAVRSARAAERSASATEESAVSSSAAIEIERETRDVQWNVNYEDDMSRDLVIEHAGSTPCLGMNVRITFDKQADDFVIDYVSPGDRVFVALPAHGPDDEGSCYRPSNVVVRINWLSPAGKGSSAAVDLRQARGRQGSGAYSSRTDKKVGPELGSSEDYYVLYESGTVSSRTEYERYVQRKVREAESAPTTSGGLAIIHEHAGPKRGSIHPHS